MRHIGAGLSLLVRAALLFTLPSVLCAGVAPADPCGSGALCISWQIHAWAYYVLPCVLVASSRRILTCTLAPPRGLSPYTALWQCHAGTHCSFPQCLVDNWQVFRNAVVKAYGTNSLAWPEEIKYTYAICFNKIVGMSQCRFLPIHSINPSHPPWLNVTQICNILF